MPVVTHPHTLLSYTRNGVPSLILPLEHPSELWHLIRARYYEPNTGRFISQDPYKGDHKVPSTLNLYAYCQNNPINYIDPTGLDRKSVSEAIDRIHMSTGKRYRTNCLGFVLDILRGALKSQLGESYDPEFDPLDLIAAMIAQGYDISKAASNSKFEKGDILIWKGDYYWYNSANNRYEIASGFHIAIVAVGGEKLEDVSVVQVSGLGPKDENGKPEGGAFGSIPLSGFPSATGGPSPYGPYGDNFMRFTFK